MEAFKFKASDRLRRFSPGIATLAVTLLVGTWIQPPVLRGEMVEQKDRIIYRSGASEQEAKTGEMEERLKQASSRRMLENIIIEGPSRPGTDHRPTERPPRR